MEEDVSKFQLRVGEMLYCQGAERPAWRGLLHYYAIFLLPFGLYFLLLEAQTATELCAAITLCVTSLMCFGVSSAYHRIHWSPRYEVLLQKLDHCAIFIVTAGIITPTSLLALESTRLYVLGLAWAACVWGSFLVFNQQKKSYHHIISAAVILLGLPEMLGTMTHLELCLGFATYAQYLIGLVIYSFKWPEPFPGYFGAHEIMHALTITASATAFLQMFLLLRRFDSGKCLFSYPTALWNLLEQ